MVYIFDKNLCVWQLNIFAKKLPDIDNINKNNKARKIIKPSEKELKFHNDYLKNQLKKNYYI